MPPDYYYEDSQEGGAGVRNQHLHQQGNRESITDSASPIQVKFNNMLHLKKSLVAAS